MRTIFVLITMMIIPVTLFAYGTVTGTVIDRESGEIIWDVLIKVPTAQIETNNDYYGNFSLRIPEGKHRMTFMVLGYQTLVKRINVIDGETVTLNVSLSPAETAIGLAVETTAQRRQVTVGQTTIERADIENTARSSFISDLSSTLNKLPGVASGGDFSGALYIRGGYSWENLWVIDRVILTQPYKWGGIMSLINPDIVGNVNFYAGGYPVEYGMALSGIIHAETLDPPKDRQNHGYFKMDPANFSGYAYGPLNQPGSRSGYLVSARVTYYDLVAPIFMKMRFGDEIDTSGIRLPYFSDAFGKLYFDLAPQHKLTLSGLYFQDGMKIEFRKLPQENTEQGGAPSDLLEQDPDMAFEYKDHTAFASSTYNFIPGEKLRLNTSLSYVYMLGKYEFTHRYFPFTAEQSQSEVQLYIDANYQPFDWYHINIGTISIPRLSNTYAIDSTSRISYMGFDTNMIPIQIFETNTFNSNYTLIVDVYSAFFENEVTLVPEHWVVNAGVRMDSFLSEQVWSPRLLTKVTVGNGWDIKGAYGLFQQYAIDGMTDPQGNNQNLDTEKAWHYVAGLEKIFDRSGIKLRSELFYKDYFDLVNPENSNANYYANNTIGNAYGWELFVEKKLTKNINGWFTYTYSESWRQVVERSEPYGEKSSADHPEIGIWYHPGIDQPHIVNVYADWQVNNWFGTIFDFKYHAGAPYTPVTGTTHISNADYEVYFPEWGRYHSKRMPDYHRLNVSLLFNMTEINTISQARRALKLEQQLSDIRQEIDAYDTQLNVEPPLSIVISNDITNHIIDTNWTPPHLSYSECNELTAARDELQKEYDEIEHIWAEKSHDEIYWGYLLAEADSADTVRYGNRLRRKYERMTRIEPLSEVYCYLDFHNIYNIFMPQEMALEHNPVDYHFNQNTGTLEFSRDLPFMVLPGFRMDF